MFITKILLHGGSFHIFSCNFGQAGEYGSLYRRLHYKEVCQIEVPLYIDL